MTEKADFSGKVDLCFRYMGTALTKCWVQVHVQALKEGILQMIMQSLILLSGVLVLCDRQEL
jgi:hypothetical protein